MKNIEYWNNGVVERVYDSDKDGKIHGSYKSFWSNSKTSVKTSYINGKRNGLGLNREFDGEFGHLISWKENEVFGLVFSFNYTNKNV